MHKGLAIAALGIALPGAAQAQIADPLAARVELDDARRFAELYRETWGTPTAAQLQERYIEPGSDAVAIFTPGRIVDGANLAATVAANPAAYTKAIDRCLPWAEQSSGELKATYLALHGLLPERLLPRIAVLFGAGNSGGTAGAGMQVLGLEVLCAGAPDEAAFRTALRGFFAHETIHTLQRIDPGARDIDLMLATAIAEGSADYVATLVTGQVGNVPRAEWAAWRRSWVFAEFAKDRAAMAAKGVTGEERQARFRRWFANAGSAPEGWPSELGYWVGSEIAAGYVAGANDPHAAIRDLLSFRDPRAIVRQSGLAAVVAPELD
ncbi:hypothetical protein N0B51_10650 [Tsuneonella sp. YG55]|uniref:DUF2268 domain-containing protein n=1 Tax=Tsuneonella litorea TaxID=2976475 RepID=A0A9X2W2L9_9SPHN|nr:hypothetical protein [Tsuneonella litorea]MCT2559438.1 hypothetical protein [Tsuneonella litorea]